MYSNAVVVNLLPALIHSYTYSTTLTTHKYSLWFCCEERQDAKIALQKHDMLKGSPVGPVCPLHAVSDRVTVQYFAYTPKHRELHTNTVLCSPLVTSQTPLPNRLSVFPRQPPGGGRCVCVWVCACVCGGGGGGGWGGLGWLH